jgi:hypothetical protein
MDVRQGNLISFDFGVKTNCTFLLRRGVRVCGRDEGAMETDERLRSPPRPLRIAHPCCLNCFASEPNASALTENNIFPPPEAKHNNNEGKPFSFGAESAIIDMLGKNQQRGNPAVGRA